MNPLKEVKINEQTTSRNNIPADDSCQTFTEEQENENRKQRTGLNLSLIGLILSVFAGLGIFFSIAGIAVGACRYKRDNVACKYAIGLGIAGVIMSVIFGVLLTIVIITLL